MYDAANKNYKTMPDETCRSAQMDPHLRSTPDPRSIFFTGYKGCQLEVELYRWGVGKSIGATRIPDFTGCDGGEEVVRETVYSSPERGRVPRDDVKQVIGPRQRNGSNRNRTSGCLAVVRL